MHGVAFRFQLACHEATQLLLAGDSQVHDGAVADVQVHGLVLALVRALL